MRVLVVEDDKKIASFVVNGLKQSGFAVDHCLDGEQGLVMARSAPYDVAVIDIMLPKRDGLSLVQQLRKENLLAPWESWGKGFVKADDFLAVMVEDLAKK